MGGVVVVGGNLGFRPSLCSEVPCAPCHWGPAPAGGWPWDQSSQAGRGIIRGCQFMPSSPQVLAQSIPGTHGLVSC